MQSSICALNFGSGESMLVTNRPEIAAGRVAPCFARGKPHEVSTLTLGRFIRRHPIRLCGPIFIRRFKSNIPVLLGTPRFLLSGLSSPRRYAPRGKPPRGLALSLAQRDEG